MQFAAAAPVSVAGCALAVVAAFVNWNWRYKAEDLAFDADAVQRRGQWYRAFTAPLAHSSLAHLVISVLGWTSAAGLVGSRRLSVYSASKHAVVGLTKSAALEYAADNIRVNAVCPGIIDTPMMDRLVEGRDDYAAAIPTRQPIGRKGTPNEIAEAVAWLCSDAASLVTGLAMAVDGAFTAQ